MSPQQDLSKLAAEGRRRKRLLIRVWCFYAVLLLGFGFFPPVVWGIYMAVVTGISLYFTRAGLAQIRAIRQAQADEAAAEALGRTGDL